MNPNSDDHDWIEQMGDVEYDPRIHEAGYADTDDGRGIGPDDGTPLGIPAPPLP